MSDRHSGGAETHLEKPEPSTAEAELAAYEAALGAAGPLLATAMEDRRLVRQLLAMPPLERATAAVHESRFHRPTLARMMALEAEAALLDPAGDPRPAAELAAAIAAALPRDSAGVARRTAALAYWLLGKGLLRSRHCRLAREAFQVIFAFLPGGEISEEAALVSAGMAQLHEDTGDLDSATACWLWAAYLFAKLGAAQPAAACQGQLGLLLLDAGELANARFPLKHALALIDGAFAPSFTARVRLALAEAAAALGDQETAREEVARARKLYPLAFSPAEWIEQTWREGRIAVLARHDGEAEVLLDSARCALVRSGSLGEAARVTFDQVLLRMERARGAGVRELTARLAEEFPGPGEKWAIEMAVVARRAVARPEESRSQCAAMRLRLRQPRRADARRPPALTSSRLLGDRLLRRRGEQEDPIGAAEAEV
jgi:hypothetical protein